MAETAKETKTSYPYVSFRTILNLLERFKADGGVPTRVDRGVLTGSEGSKTQLIAALKFLNLINSENETLPAFGDLAMKEAERPALVAALIKRHFPKQAALGAKPSTQKQLQESFEDLADETRRKAVAFFLHAAKFSGIPLSQYFKTPRIGRPAGSPNRKRRAPSTSKKNGNVDTPVAEDANRQKYIDLLMKKLEEGDQMDPELLNRIEGLLGYRKPN